MTKTLSNRTGAPCLPRLPYEACLFDISSSCNLKITLSDETTGALVVQGMPNSPSGYLKKKSNLYVCFNKEIKSWGY